MLEPDPFLTISETMAVLKVSRGSVRNMITAGTLRRVVRPHCPRVLREDVLALATPPEGTPRAQQGRTG